MRFRFPAPEAAIGQPAVLTAHKTAGGVPVLTTLFTALLSLILAFLLPLSSIYAAAEENSATATPPSHVINVVYDDSGSMIFAGAKNEIDIDRWCEAKYALEVFAAMMGSTDRMNIFYMSDYSNGLAGGAGLSLKGSDGAKSNVSAVHQKVTVNGNTPFETVEGAYDALRGESADEKWLVILTDGAFNDPMGDPEAVRQYLEQKDDDINVMFLAMGDGAEAIRPDEDNQIFSDHAATSDEILTKVTEICTRIYNTDRLDVNGSTISFDVPMSELTVFAQGANVTINGLTDPSGKTIQPSSTPVTVQYSEQATARAGYEDRGLVNEDLKGSIAVFTGDFSAGDYKADVDGASTVQVYYKPNVAIGITLKDADGNPVNDTSNLRAGTYTLDFGFVRNGTNEPVGDSKLLGNITYTASVTNNGQQVREEIKKGDQFEIAEGDLDIEAEATYLGYHHVTTSRHFGIFEDKPITFTVTKDGRPGLNKDGSVDPDPIEVTAQVNGNPVTADQWASMGVPQISITEKPFEFLWEREFTEDTPEITKTDRPGVYQITPVFLLDDDGKAPKQIEYGKDIPYTLSFSEAHGDSTWAGGFEGTYHTKDDRSWLERHGDVIKVALIFTGFLILLGGYLFKKRFPRSMQKSPRITVRATAIGAASPARKNYSGKFEKSLLSVIIPYRAERGTLRYTPGGVPSTRLQLKAAGGTGMIVKNYRSFGGKKDIKFDGMPVEKDIRKPLRITAGTQIEITVNGLKYTCIPNTK